MRAILVAAALCAGCGPIEYVNNVTLGATSKVEAARAAGADQASPYWWTRATTYLRQARIEAGAADYEAANRFGKLAGEAADEALAEAKAGKATP